MIVRTAVRRSAYYDSVTLMQAQQALRALLGIAEAGVIMGTPANISCSEGNARAALLAGMIAARTPDAATPSPPQETPRDRGPRNPHAGCPGRAPARRRWPQTD